VTLIKPSGIDTPIAQHAANHGPGKALVPPPTYAHELVADASSTLPNIRGAARAASKC
jgi:hypothetical protein